MHARTFKWQYPLLLAITLILPGCISTKSNPYKQGQADFYHQHYSKAFEELLSPAIHGDARAQYAIGYMYYYGLGVAKNEDMARNWFRKSAKIGYPEAQHALELLMKPDFPEHPPLPVTQPIRHALNNKPYRAPATVLSSDNFTKDLDWIREQNPNSYTLLLATTSSKSLAKRRRKQRYGRQRLAQYRYLQQAKTRYGTVYGSFDNQAQANKVKKRLLKNNNLSMKIISWHQVQDIMLP